METEKSFLVDLFSALIMLHISQRLSYFSNNMTPTEPDFPPKGSLLTQQEAIYAKCTDNLLTIGAFSLFDFREKVLLFRGAGGSRKHEKK